MLAQSVFAACAPQEATLNPTWEEFVASPPMTWEQYRASVKVDGERYIIEGDIAVSGEEAVRLAYDAWLRRAFDAIDHGTSELRIATGPAGRVRWSQLAAQDLSYCVSDEFWDNKPAAVAVMNRATLSWSARVKVVFRYVPEADASCDATNPNVVFRVRPSSNASNVTFYPDAPPALRDLIIAEGWFYGTDPDAFSGVVRHDLGHILGFAHEPASCVDPYDRPAEQLSDNAMSIMRSPCAYSRIPSVQSASDYAGAAMVYGASGGTAQLIESAFAYNRYTEPYFADTVEYPDVDGDGKSDICGVTEAAIVHCRTAGGVVFTTTFGANNLYPASTYSTIHFVDVSGDGKDDVCGRMSDGLWCGLSQGTSFTAPSRFTTAFANYKWSWANYYWDTIKFVDLNVDGKMDICGRGETGIVCALSLGTSFTGEQLWSGTDFLDAHGWQYYPAYWKTIQYPDVNGDGLPDVCGRAHFGILCGLSTGSSFRPASYWTFQYSNADGWATFADIWTTFRFADLNGDGRDDLCARGTAALHCALSDGTKLLPTSFWTTAFSNLFGGNRVSESFQLTDIDYDGRADACASSEHGVLCTRSNGTSFGRAEIVAAGFGASAFVGPVPYYTLAQVDRFGDGSTQFCSNTYSGTWCSQP